MGGLAVLLAEGRFVEPLWAVRRVSPATQEARGCCARELSDEVSRQTATAAFMGVIEQAVV